MTHEFAQEVRDWAQSLGAKVREIAPHAPAGIPPMAEKAAMLIERDGSALDAIVEAFKKPRIGWKSRDAKGDLLDEIEEAVRKTGRVI